MRFRSVFLMLVLGVITLTSRAQENKSAPSVLQWSPNGQWLAQGYMDSRILIYSVNDLTKGIELKLESPISSIAWSPDSSRVAVGLYASENISIWDTRTGSPIGILKSDKVYNGGGTYVSWNPKQEILVSIADDWESGGNPLRFWDTQTYSQIGLGEVFAVYPISSSLNWSPDGTQLAIATLTQDLRIYDVFRGENIVSKHRIEGLPLPGGISYVDWSPDGTKLAAIKYETQFVFDEEQRITLSEYDSSLIIVDAKTLEEVAQITEPVHNAVDPFLWSPDGGRIAILHPDTIEVIDAQTGGSLEEYAVDAYNLNAAWSPFGGRLAIAETSNLSATQRASDSLRIQFVVPSPSSTLLNSIEATCVPAHIQAVLPSAETLLSETTTPLTNNVPITNYIDAVETNTRISPACAADLIAVAEALQAEQERR